jgi:phosphopantetheinyl transferase
VDCIHEPSLRDSRGPDEKELEWTLRTPSPSYRTELLGKVWRKKEVNGWEGLHTRRGDSTLFDAIWTRKESEKVTGVLIMHLSGNKVFIEHRHQSNGREFDSEGTISEDSRTLSGTFWPAGSTAPILRWKATIER